MIKKNKNICFVANFGRTLSFSLVAKELSKKGYNVYWIVPNKILLEKYNLENSLYIGYDILNTNTSEQSFENERKFLYSDRVLNDSSARDTKYLRKLRVLTSNFLANNRIKL